MKEERFFEPCETSVSNLGISLAECEKQIKLYRCELAFIADSFADRIRELLDSGLAVSEAFLQLSEEVDFFPPQSDGGIFGKMPDLLGKAVFSELMAEKLNERNIKVSVTDFLKTDSIPQTFVYVRNALADEAYDVFAEDFSDPRVSYASSFRDAAFAVADGKAGYCILPYEESESSRISGIYNLTLALDLKIVAITPVFGLAGNADVKYALFSRDFSVPEKDSDTDRYIEIRIPFGSVSLGEVYSASDFFGLSAVSVNTVAGGTEEKEKSCAMVFREERDIVPFLIYLTLFVSEFTPMGVYKNIE